MFRLFLLRRALKASRRQKRVVGFDKARSILVLYELLPDKTHEFMNSFIRQIEDDGKKVEVIGYDYSKKAAEPQLSGPGHIVSKSDFSWTMKPKNQQLKKLLAGPHYDIILDLSSSHAMRLKFLAVYIPASYKAGAAHPDFLNIYDLILDVGEDCSQGELAKHALHYLKIIKTPS